MSDSLHHNQQRKPTLSSSSSSVFFKLFSDPIKIFFRNKHVLIPVLLFLTLPLSFLLFSLSLTSRPIKRHIFHLESVAFTSSTRVEADHILKESRYESLSLFRLKLLYFLPSSILSLLAFVATVHVTSHSHRPSFLTTADAFKRCWKRVLVTSACSYALLLLYVQLPQLFYAVFRNHPRISLPILLIGSGFEVYLMGVLGLGLVVSALEEKFGWDAFRVGSELMVGRRVCWWWVTCMLVAISGWIGNRFEKLTDGEDSVQWVVMGWETVGLWWFYGFLVIWSLMVTTVFYCDCKRNHAPNGTELTEITA
ncbi:hypothetical protein PVK06_013488 [Gossypium arboreum]|uniref:Transmembrane protein n=1 Tax=Gossypium arboreum TaxID=29729 RepID=A0ABR0PRT0_GOSAR|nr:hypothetical protein PVK06_013488 [Gossypium arboreum]